MQSNQDAVREAMRLAGSPAGKQLLAFLQKTDPQSLQQALQSAAAGNYTQAQQTLSGLLNHPEARTLLSKLGGDHGSDGR